MNASSSESSAETTDPLSRELVQSVVDTARALFGAAASSVFLLDRERHELVFEAVSGQGENHLVGRRFPAESGIAGWVAMSGEPMIVDDLTGSTAFDRDFAESTAYVPDALMAAPLTHGDLVLGVLEVLDPAPQSRSDLGELDLLALFARQAAVALRVVVDRRHQSAGSRSRADDRAAALRMAEDLRRLLEASQ
ncbi:GAF domain-containing protein [Actinacidiphila acididurans]|uniref:GAF domain-containing protein n=1 Tax=Actinacidiphila acididurans TaxID=2784346 RepID=A0ABS2TZX0_9ACTN|nr:GAF domain-containing protein [Actinacidiphila acididurans]MBM9508892.1 GAF domain-containing protein [Actinacidiphila acididurans]